MINIVQTKEVDTVSIKRKNPTTHSMGLVVTLSVLVTQLPLVLKEISRVKINRHRKYIPSMKCRVWMLANYATGVGGP